MVDKRIPAARIREVWLNDDLTTAEAAARVGLTRVSLWRRAKALSLPARKDGVRSQVRGAEREAEFGEMWRANVLEVEMAAYFGTAPRQPSAIARRLGLPPRTGNPKRISLSAYMVQKALRVRDAKLREQRELQHGTTAIPSEDHR